MDILHKQIILEETKYYRLYKPWGSSKYKLQEIIFKFGWIKLPKTIMVFDSKQEAVEFITKQGYII